MNGDDFVGQFGYLYFQFIAARRSQIIRLEALEKEDAGMIIHKFHKKILNFFFLEIFNFISKRI